MKTLVAHISRTAISKTKKLFFTSFIVFNCLAKIQENAQTKKNNILHLRKLQPNTLHHTENSCRSFPTDTEKLTLFFGKKIYLRGIFINT